MKSSLELNSVFHLTDCMDWFLQGQRKGIMQCYCFSDLKVATLLGNSVPGLGVCACVKFI